MAIFIHGPMSSGFFIFFRHNRTGSGGNAAGQGQARQYPEPVRPPQLRRDDDEVITGFLMTVLDEL